MPIYVYRCSNGHSQEIYQRMGEDAPPCADCSQPMERQITSFGFPRLWNGSGVWVLDRQHRSPDWDR